MQMSDPEEILRIYYDNLSSRFFVSYSEAMENNQTFEEFRANAMKLGLELKPQLKSSFISDLIAKHCGSAVYGERLRVLPNGMLHIHSGMIFSKQFDPRGHAYYDGGMAATQ